MRRQALNPFFSKASIFRLQPIITSLIEKLCTRIDECKDAGQPVNMRLAYMCLTTDVITSYALNRCWNHLDIPDWSPLWCKTIRETGEMSKWLKQFPWMWKIMKGLPENIVGALNPGLILVLEMQNVSLYSWETTARTHQMSRESKGRSWISWKERSQRKTTRKTARLEPYFMNSSIAICRLKRRASIIWHRKGKT